MMSIKRKKPKIIQDNVKKCFPELFKKTKIYKNEINSDNEDKIRSEKSNINLDVKPSNEIKDINEENVKTKSNEEEDNTKYENKINITDKKNRINPRKKKEKKNNKKSKKDNDNKTDEEILFKKLKYDIKKDNNLETFNYLINEINKIKNWAVKVIYFNLYYDDETAPKCDIQNELKSINQNVINCINHTKNLEESVKSLENKFDQLINFFKEKLPFKDFSKLIDNPINKENS